MDESKLSDAALAELLTLTVDADEYATIYRNHLGQFHRVHGPAVILVHGGRRWYQNGRLHSTVGPAIENVDSPGHWCLDGQIVTKEEWNERTQSL